MSGKYDHIVVAMLENRSFDNILGWAYSPDNAPPWDKPRGNIPFSPTPTFDGLQKGKYWNETPGPNPTKVYATCGTTGAKPFSVPTPDPQELFDHMNFQQFETETPAEGQTATMSGFIKDYATREKNPNPEQIMECYSPEQVPVLTALARNYAVCDRWFGAVPCQTWPNRGFMHAGTSCGRVNNCDHNHDNCVPDPGYYDTKSIFNVLEKMGHSWRVYNDTFLMSLTRAQFIEHLGDPLLEDHFHSFDTFKKDALEGQLPAYSFLEPSFLIEPNDQHPPHDMIVGEKFIYDIWTAVSRGKKWKTTLLLITYDEHGGCYDHHGPKWTATKPDDSKPQQPFGFNRWGPRVPAVLVSPWIEAGMVFRSPDPAIAEYDHTSVLATLRDWLQIPADQMLTSKRIAKAPTLDQVLSRPLPRSDIPDIPKPAVTADMLKTSDQPLTTIQKAVIAATATKGKELTPEERTAFLDKLFAEVKTPAEAAKYFGQE